MTFAKSIELHFLAGHQFYVKLTRMSIVPYHVVYLPENCCNTKLQVKDMILTQETSQTFIPQCSL